jgi:hypothetical protein
VGVRHRADDARHAGGLGEGGGERRTVGALDLARRAVAARRREAGRSRGDVGGQPRGRRLARSHPLLEQRL